MMNIYLLAHMLACQNPKTLTVIAFADTVLLRSQIDEFKDVFQQEGIVYDRKKHQYHYDNGSSVWFRTILDINDVEGRQQQYLITCEVYHTPIKPVLLSMLTDRTQFFVIKNKQIR